MRNTEKKKKKENMFVNESLKKRLNEGIIRKNFSSEKKLRCYWLNAKMLCTTFVRTRNL